MSSIRRPVPCFTLTIVSITLLYVWPVVYFVGHRHWMGTTVILFNLGLCLVYNRRHSRSQTEWGFSWRDFFPGLRLALYFTTPVLLAIFFAGLRMNSLVGRENPAQDLLGLFGWALAQQFALQTVIFSELRKTISQRWAIWAAALLFSILHLPNPFLTLLTLAAALAWCWIYSRHPNLLPIALSHSLSSLMILASLSPCVTGALRVGYAYLLL